MREIIKKFVGICAVNLPVKEPIYEFGALQVPGQEGFADLRIFFPGKNYIGCDLIAGPGVDQILDIHKINLPDQSVGTVLALETLEHVQYPQRAMQEIYRILKPGGLVVISSVMDHAIHNFPTDYWRFTPAGFDILLASFPVRWVEFVGKSDFPHTVVGVGLKTGPAPLPSQFYQQMKNWKKAGQLDWRELLKILLPPALLYIYRNVRDRIRQIAIRG